MLRPVVSVVLVLGVVYTLKVLDIILGLTHGGPANATQTIATHVVPAVVRRVRLRQGAAWSNILVLTSLVFALIYLRANRRARVMNDGTAAGSRRSSWINTRHRAWRSWPSCCSRSTG